MSMEIYWCRMKASNFYIFLALACFFYSQSFAQKLPEGYQESRKRSEKLARIVEQRGEYNGPLVSLSIGSGAVEYHGKKGSGKPFPIARNFPGLSSQATIQAEQSQYRAVDYLYELPICQSSEVKRVEVGELSVTPRRVDYLFYSFLDPGQREQGEAWKGLAVPYYAPEQRESAEETFVTALQYYAIQFGVTCLPTRVHLVENEEEQKSFLEYRAGEKAWDGSGK